MPDDTGPSPAIVLAVAGLLVAPAAGCLSGGPSPTDGQDADPGDEASSASNRSWVRGPPSTHVLDEIVAFETEAGDGTALRGHVYLPNGTGPFPVILNYSPYWNGIGNSGSEELATADGSSMQRTIHGDFGTLLEAGFAVALVNIRGTGESGGCNTWFDFEQDGADARHVIQALANASWSNGNVGMAGISWHGYTQYAALADPPDALKAVAPASSILDLWELFTRRGPPLNLYGTMASTYAVFQAIVMGDAGQFPADRPRCPGHAEQVLAFNQLTTHGDKTEFFQRRTAHGILDDSDVPMFVTNGLGPGEGHILQVDGLWPLMPDQGRLVLGQWGHEFPDDERYDRYWTTLAGWFDGYLREGPQTVDSGFVEYQDTNGTWHTADAWPPAANATRLHLSDGTVVDDEAEGSTSTQTFVGTDTSPAPTRCTENKALYVSEPLAEDALLAGNFTTNLTLTSTAPRSNIGVYVWHVDELRPCPTLESPVQDGDIQLPDPDSAPDQVGRALSDLRHRGGHLEQGETFPVGTPGEVAMRSVPFASPVAEGERLVVAVVGGSPDLSPKDPDPSLTVRTGEDVEAWIELPVVQGALTFGDG